MSPGSHQCVFISGTNEVDADVLKELLDLANCETSMRTDGEEEVKISDALVAECENYNVSYAVTKAIPPFS